MAAVSFTATVRFPASMHNQQLQATGRNSFMKLISVGSTRNGFRSMRTSRFSVSCLAKPETIDKVCEIVKKQLALAPDSKLTPETTFSDLGADSLDTVEIVMGLEEEFDLNVEEDGSENITTVQEAADLIEKLIQKKAETA